MDLEDPEAGRPTLDTSAETSTRSPASSSGGPYDASAAQELIGPYLLLRKLGEGGMGQVWLAQQTSPVKRQVALKVIGAAGFSKDALARFHLEQQALAIMEHPSIAKVFDAGATPDGQPYFVMEYVPGEAITDYCDRKRLSIRERLELFARVCDGVQHAHQKAIMHRDLKPSNILVVEIDGQPTPRIIDFGIAKSLSQPSPNEAMLTRYGGFIGTPGYMSPEQADPAIADVDTRTDVYSLGVVLYELLTGCLPFDPKQWEGDHFWDALRRLKEDDPPRASTRIRSDRESSTTAAQNRQMEPRQLTTTLRGDLDWIAAKALERNRERRYGTPSELAADIERFLADEPIVARPPSRAYLVRKYVQRHKFGVGACASLAALLVAFALLQGAELRRVTQERDRADRITQFMIGMFKVPDPSESRGNSVTAREILDKGAKQIESSLENDSQVQAQLMYAMAQSYDGLGLYPRAQDLAQKTYDIERRVFGPRARITVKSMSQLGAEMIGSGDEAQALKSLENTLAVAQNALGPEDPDTLMTRLRISDALYGASDFQQAETFARETLALDRRVLGPENPETMQVTSRLAESLDALGDYPEAEKLKREVFDFDQRKLGADDPGTLSDMNSLVHVLSEERKYPEAEALANQAFGAEQRILGLSHSITIDGLGDFAYLYLHEKKYPQAARLFGQLVNQLTRIHGPKSVLVLPDMEELAIAYAHQGKYADASKLFRQAIGVAEKDKEAVYTMVGWYNFACGAAAAGHRDDAFRYLRKAIDHGFTYPDHISTDTDLASLHSDPRFAAIVELARQRATTQEK